MTKPRHEFKIEKGIPLPSRPDGGKGITEALRACEIGDSFHREGTGGRTGIYVMARNVGIRITLRAEGDGYRIWRIA